MDDETLKLVPSPLIERLKAQPPDQAGYVVLNGFIGAVTDDCVQVYPALDLRVSYKIARKDIISCDPPASDQTSVPTRLVVDASVNVDVVQEASVSASFLSGSIAQQLIGVVGVQGIITGADGVSQPPPVSVIRAPSTACTALPPILFFPI